MVEDSPPQKNEEQYPLLKVDAGGGDVGRIQPPGDTPGWSVSCSPKRPWSDRWPELISACWMSGMLLVIFFLILYGLGLGVIHRQPLLRLHYNDSKPVTEVYYHHIVRHGSPVPFGVFSAYLSNMASLYSYLQFNVLFLIDDSYQSGFRGFSHSNFFHKLYGTVTESCAKFDVSNKYVKEFELKYQNVNITVIPLSRYMHMTPLRYKWRAIPITFLPFYARIYSVWQSGGIGMDLEVFNKQFGRHQLPDRRIREILKQHNNGIKADEYASTLKKIDKEDQNEIESLFNGMIHQFLDVARTFLNFTLPLEKEVDSIQTLTRTHRNKRDILDNYKDPINKTFNEYKTEQVKITNETGLKVVDTVYQNIVNGSTLNIEMDLNKTNDLKQFLVLNNKLESITELNESNGTVTKNISEVPNIFLLYDFSLISDNRPSYIMSNPLMQPIAPRIAKMKNVNSKWSQYLLSIYADGCFVAASSKLHPFLSQIISAGCQRMSPRFAIEDALITQCSTIFRDDVYCNNIYIL